MKPGVRRSMRAAHRTSRRASSSQRNDRASRCCSRILIESAEMPAGREAGLGRGQAAPGVLIFRGGEVRVDFARDRGRPATAGACERAASGSAGRATCLHPSPTSSLLTSPDSRRQRAACAARARAPAFVMA